MTSIQKTLIVLTCSILIGTSCEKVIDLPLDITEQKVVIEAETSNFIGKSIIKLSKTGDVYTESNFDKISNATVTVTDNNGVVSVFNEAVLGTGEYSNPTFIVEETKIYNLSVETEGETYTATSQSYSTPSIDVLFADAQVGGFSGSSDTTYLLFYNFTDNAAETNYYRFRITVNGEVSNNIYGTDDILFNGQNYTAPFFSDPLDKGDTAFVELISIDQANYDFFFSLANTGDGSPFSATPANPVTNIKNGGLGYYGANLVDTMTYIVE
jgi:hypothetical protein